MVTIWQLSTRLFAVQSQFWRHRIFFNLEYSFFIQRLERVCPPTPTHPVDVWLHGVEGHDGRKFHLQQLRKVFQHLLERLTGVGAEEDSLLAEAVRVAHDLDRPLEVPPRAGRHVAAPARPPSTGPTRDC